MRVLYLKSYTLQVWHARQAWFYIWCKANQPQGWTFRQVQGRLFLISGRAGISAYKEGQLRIKEKPWRCISHCKVWHVRPSHCGRGDNGWCYQDHQWVTSVVWTVFFITIHALCDIACAPTSSLDHLGDLEQLASNFKAVFFQAFFSAEATIEMYVFRSMHHCLSGSLSSCLFAPQ